MTITKEFQLFILFRILLSLFSPKFSVPAMLALFLHFLLTHLIFKFTFNIKRISLVERVSCSRLLVSGTGNQHRASVGRSGQKRAPARPRRLDSFCCCWVCWVCSLGDKYLFPLCKALRWWRGYGFTRYAFYSSLKPVLGGGGSKQKLSEKRAWYLLPCGRRTRRLLPTCFTSDERP